MDSKKERFKRLATKRTNEVLKKLKILGNCANRYAYDYSDEDVKRIFEVIENNVKKVKMRFSSNNSQREFRL